MKIYVKIKNVEFCCNNLDEAFKLIAYYLKEGLFITIGQSRISHHWTYSYIDWCLLSNDKKIKLIERAAR